MDSHSDPNLLDCHGSSPLSLAIRTRILESTRFDIVDELCKGQADVNVRDGSTYTPLHMAAYYGRASIARRLLEFGADLNAQALPLPTSWWVSRDEHRDPWWAGHETALHFASGRGHLHTAHLLITFEAQLELLDGRGQSWVQVATGSVATLHQAFLATTSQQATSGPCPRACDVCHARHAKNYQGITTSVCCAYAHKVKILTCLFPSSGKTLLPGVHTNAWTGAATQTAASEVLTTAPPAFAPPVLLIIPVVWWKLSRFSRNGCGTDQEKGIHLDATDQTTHGKSSYHD
eukprot:Skav200211  [mRNA]  locus=scaffold890:140:1009:- [translate_table: standard]